MPEGPDSAVRSWIETFQGQSRLDLRPLWRFDRPSGPGALALEDPWGARHRPDWHARGLLISQAALLFTGTSRIQSGAGLPFGDGLRCAGGQIRRLGVRLPGPDGAADWDFGGLASGNGWSAGEVRTYQVWYRDSNSSPCGSGYNLTNGLEVTFQP